MFRYKNIGIVTKTFYDVEFKPGDIKEVPGYINARKFIRLPSKESNTKLTNNGSNSVSGVDVNSISTSIQKKGANTTLKVEPKGSKQSKKSDDLVDVSTDVILESKNDTPDETK